MPRSVRPALVAALLVACALPAASASASAFAPAPAPAPPPAETAGVPDCRMRDVFPDKTREALALAEATGDLQRMAAAMRAPRAALDAALRDDPEAAAKAKPALDRAFSAQTLRDRARCEFVGGLRDDLMPIWAAWARDPAMQRIHATLMTVIQTMPEVGDGDEDPSRLARLTRLSRAMMLNELVAARVHERGYLLTILEEARDPLSGAKAAFERSGYRRGPGDEDIAAMWLAPALRDIDDRELDRFLAFAESEAGHQYYRSLPSAHSHQLNAWHGALAKALSEALRPPSAAVGSPAEAEALLAEAAMLYESGDAGATARAHALLRRAAAIDPRNARIRLLQGRIALSIREGPKPDLGEARVPSDPKYFAEAETHLREAIALDPTLAEAYVAYGRARFLQNDDADAERNYRLAREHRCDCPRLDHHEGDLHAVRQAWQAAYDAYRRAFAHPDSNDHLRRDAFAKLLDVGARVGREDDVRTLGIERMRAHPGDVHVGEILVSHLMNVRRDYATALAIVEAAGRDQGYGWTQLHAFALSGVARQGADRRGRLSGRSAQRMRDAIAMIGGADLARIHCLSQSDAGTFRAIVEHSEAPKATATDVLGCLLMTRNLDAAKAVVALGADVNAATRYPYEDMPLCFAAYVRNPDMFGTMLDAGADPARACRDGRTVRAMLETWRNEGPDIARMLEMLPAGATAP